MAGPSAAPARLAMNEMTRKVKKVRVVTKTTRLKTVITVMIKWESDTQEASEIALNRIK